MHISLKPEIIGYFLGLPIANSLILSLIVTLLLVGLAILAVKSLKMAPGKIQNSAESLIETLLDFMANALGDRKQAMQFFPLVASFFLIILFNNWVGVMPGVGSIMLEGSHAERFPLFRAANSDLNTTLALAFVSVIAIQWYGVRKFGFFGHFSKFFVFTKGPIQLFVGLLELVGELAKVLSFSFRLFGNVFAGEVLLVTIMTLVPIIAPLPFFLLEFFVGFIQALVFSMLTLVFLKIATETAEH
ncbi:MAG: F0F1 ATP synthase subunit A [Candidatus Wildermuthbacteria bacterium]|nr:F0F1 ATP synthase subunit A [Candidatus Wildermuthbacteria bacterium]